MPPDGTHVTARVSTVTLDPSQENKLTESVDAPNSHERAGMMGE